MRIRDWSSDVCSSDLVGVVPRRARGPAAGAQQQPGVARAVFMAVLAVDRFALRHAIILPVDSERHVAGGDEVHFDAGMGIVPDRAVREIFYRYITAQLPVYAFGPVEV